MKNLLKKKLFTLLLFLVTVLFTTQAIAPENRLGLGDKDCTILNSITFLKNFLPAKYLPVNTPEEFAVSIVPKTLIGKKLAQVIGRDSCYFPGSQIPLITTTDVADIATVVITLSIANAAESYINVSNVAPKKAAPLIIKGFILRKMEMIEQSLWRKGIKKYRIIDTIDQWFHDHPYVTKPVNWLLIHPINKFILNTLGPVDFSKMG